MRAVSGPTGEHLFKKPFQLQRKERTKAVPKAADRAPASVWLWKGESAKNVSDFNGIWHEGIIFLVLFVKAVEKEVATAAVSAEGVVAKQVDVAREADDIVKGCRSKS